MFLAALVVAIVIVYAWRYLDRITAPSDRWGNPYAVVGKLAHGDIIYIDDSFSCMPNYESGTAIDIYVCVIHNEIYFRCNGSDNNGYERHYLDGQEEAENLLWPWWRLGFRRRYYIGIYAHKPTRGFVK